MKKQVLALAVASISLVAHAEGYQVNTYSARQQGMGHTGVSQILGAESLIFNPAAVASMPGNTCISASMSGIVSHVDATTSTSTYETSNKVSTPFNISAAFRINERMAAGITLFTPYGSNIDWGLNWPGAVLNQSVQLSVFNVQPTFSWKITDKFSVGAGLSLAWGSVNLKKGLVASSSFDALLGLIGVSQGNPGMFTPYGNVSPANVNLKGSSELAAGVNIGVLYEINKQWSVGASFRSKLNMHVKSGDVNVHYANDQARMVLDEYLKNLNYTNFDASMPCPYVLLGGVSWRPAHNVLLAFDLQYTGWNAYKQLDMTFVDQHQFDQHLVKDYKNSFTYHLGAEVKATRRLDVRGGLMIDTSPCNTMHYNPETPASFKIEPTVGLTFKPAPGLDVNLAFMYVFGSKVHGTGEFDDFVAPIYNGSLAKLPEEQLKGLIALTGLPAQIPQRGSFTADYKVRAFVPAIGISYTF